MLRNIVNKIIQVLKNNPSYQVDSSLPTSALIAVLVYRSQAIIRGLWYGVRYRKYVKNLFLGKNVSIRHPQLVTFGQSVIIEDHVTIDALSNNGITLGNNVTIAKYSTIQCTGVIRNLGKGIVIEDNSALGAYSFLGAQGGITIGKNVIMGPRVSLHAENHNFGQIDVPIRLQGESRRGIQIEDDCWIGAGSIILDGVCIGEGSIVAAGSVVTQNTPPYSVNAGVPARVLKFRKVDESL